MANIGVPASSRPVRLSNAWHSIPIDMQLAVLCALAGARLATALLDRRNRT